MAGVEAKTHKRMTPVQMATMVSAAFRCGAPETFFRIVIRALERADRNADALAAAYMRELHRMGEIKILIAPGAIVERALTL